MRAVLTSRTSSFRPKGVRSTGTTVGRQFMIPLIWAMLGKLESSNATRGEANSSNYLTQDIVRRILRDYFGYDVNFVMNITDIDDKVSSR
jgi:hypothetical protein